MESQQSIYYKVRLASKIQAPNIAEITRLLLLNRSNSGMPETRAFLMLANLKKRFDESASNPHDGGWTFVGLNSEEDSAVKKLVQLSPQFLEKQFPTEEETQKLLSQSYNLEPLMPNTTNRKIFVLYSQIRPPRGWKCGDIVEDKLMNQYRISDAKNGQATLEPINETDKIKSEFISFVVALKFN